MKASLNIEVDNPEFYKKTIGPELRDTEKLSSEFRIHKSLANTKCSSTTYNMEITYNGKTFASIRAGITTFLRLMKPVKELKKNDFKR